MHASISTAAYERFIRLQEAALENRESDDPKHQPRYLVRDNVTRWNSWYDAAKRAIELRQYIDEFTDDELANYNAKLARFEARSKAPPAPPKAPSLLQDRLAPNDWEVIVTYITILKPYKLATIKLQGNVSNNNNAKGAIWQVLPVFL